MDDLAKAKARREIVDVQAELRDFTNTTGRRSKSYREQLQFADGRS